MLRTIPIPEIIPNPNHGRLFIVPSKLHVLEQVYRSHLEDPSVPLPDPPVVREIPGQGFELLSGERRVTAASRAGVSELDCRVVVMDSREAYLFAIAANNHEEITTAEKAYHVAHMAGEGFSPREIGEAFGGIGVSRYLAVGELIDPLWFTDNEKLCDPPITHWYEAARHGAEHFERCFRAWDGGQWTARQCAVNFRKRGRALPLDNTEKGLRLVIGDNTIRVRGTLDLGLLTIQEARSIWQALKRTVEDALFSGELEERRMYNFNPDTLTEEWYER